MQITVSQLAGLVPEVRAFRVQCSDWNALRVLVDPTGLDVTQLGRVLLARLSNGTVTGLQGVIPIAVKDTTFR